MDTNPNGTSSVPQSLTTPTDPFPLISSDVEALLTMSNFPFENFDGQDQPPRLESPPTAASLDAILIDNESSKLRENGNDLAIESVVSLRDKDTISLPQETGPSNDSEEEVHSMIRVSSKTLDILSPPDASNVRYFISDLEEEETNCARTGGYNLRPVTGRQSRKRQASDGSKNKHPANPNKKRRQKGVENEEERECETNDAETNIQVEHEGGMREASDVEEVDVDCETENSHNQLLKLDQPNNNDQIATCDKDIHSLMDPGTLQKQLLADIWNDSPLNGHTPIPSQETQDANFEMNSVLIDLCSQCSATQDTDKNEPVTTDHVTVVTFNEKSKLTTGTEGTNYTVPDFLCLTRSQ